MKNKICVYAIAKNEIKFVDRWYNSVKEADYICVLDTGSTDGTFDRLKELKIITKQKTYQQFRFDTARNDSLKLIPKDANICVCVDLDEIFVPGWAEILRKNWKPDTMRAKYRYTWNFNKDGSEGIVFMLDKIHAAKQFKWVNPVHEILVPLKDSPYNTITLPNVQLNHRADETKSRSNYLPLLELAVKENPENDRNIHYLGREYMFYKQYDKAISTLKQHLKLKSATWTDERCASLRFIANCYKHKNDILNQEKYLLLAILENNTLREPYFDTALMYYGNKDYLKAALFFEEMLKITVRNLNYISQPHCWDATPYDYLAICYYELGDIEKAILNTKTALKFSNEQRLKDNLHILTSKLRVE